MIVEKNFLCYPADSRFHWQTRIEWDLQRQQIVVCELILVDGFFFHRRVYLYAYFISKIWPFNLKAIEHLDQFSHFAFNRHKINGKIIQHQQPCNLLNQQSN